MASKKKKGGKKSGQLGPRFAPADVERLQAVAKAMNEAEPGRPPISAAGVVRLLTLQGLPALEAAHGLGGGK